MSVQMIPEAATAHSLLLWYDRHARSLPWRSPPGSNLAPDPYAVWLSEVMLQQTTVAAVQAYYARFLDRWPRVEDLAAAPDAEVMAAWAGLGYYARARNLLACARVVAQEHGGQFPRTAAELQKLPGIGPYTAAAIAAIAFDERAVVLDANVERVVARLAAITTPLPAAKPDIYAACDQITPRQRAGDFAQAMMDLGAMVCTVRSPDCPACPLQNHCHAKALGTPEAFPARLPKKPRPERRGLLFWLENAQGHVWTITRPAKGLLGGMVAFPTSDWIEKDNYQRGHALTQAPCKAAWAVAGQPVRHIFTHFALELEILRAQGQPARGQPGQWVAPAALADLGLPSLFQKAIAAIAAST